MQQNIIEQKISLKDVLSLFSCSTSSIKDITLKEGFEFYINYRKPYVRSATGNYYKLIIPKIIELLYSKEIFTFQSITQNAINDLIFYFQSCKNKNITINKKLKALFAIIHCLEEQNIISKMDLKFKSLPEEHTQIEIVDSNDLVDVIKYVEALSASSRLKVLLLISTGIRTNELCHIECKNIDFKNLRIYLSFTKTGKPRYAPFPEELISDMKKCIEDSKESQWLFPGTNPKECINQSCIKSLLKRIKKALGIEVLSAHKLRHLYATTLLKNGVDIKTVSRLLGHTTIRMTEFYIDVIESEIHEKSRINNPLNLLTK